jgi:hypothetical protein
MAFNNEARRLRFRGFIRHHVISGRERVAKTEPAWGGSKLIRFSVYEIL